MSFFLISLDAVQVVGHKVIWVAPPDLFTGQSTSLIDGNTSTLPVFDEVASEELEAAHHVRQHAMSATLGPGDILVLPPAWYHAIQSVTRVSGQGKILSLLGFIHCSLIHLHHAFTPKPLQSFSVSMWY
jgi:hypothetical protein